MYIFLLDFNHFKLLNNIFRLIFLIIRMKLVAILFLVVIPCILANTCASDGKCETKKSSGQPPKHYNVILIGATGNLASKYLWKALFDLFKERFIKNEVRFQIYGAARQEQDAGRRMMSELFLNVFKCSDDNCREKKKSFVESSQYIRLKTERDFQVKFPRTLKSFITDQQHGPMAKSYSGPLGLTHGPMAQSSYSGPLLGCVAVIRLLHVIPLHKVLHSHFNNTLIFVPS